MRIIIADNLGNLTGELDPSRVYSVTSTEEINGEDSLTIEAAESISKQDYVLFQDAWGLWREYVVVGVDEDHQDADFVFNTYYCIRSLHYELMGTILKSQPGKNSPVNATAALTAALAGSRWSVGTVQPTTMGGTSFYYLSGWEALGKVIEVWGGELAETIQVNDSGVVSRRVHLMSQRGARVASRRFEFGFDTENVKRVVEDAPYYCRVIPRGAAIESDSGGYGRKIGIASVNPTGEEYLEDSSVVDMVKIPDGNGGFIYPTTVVEYEDISSPQLLYDTALADLPNFTNPRISYEVGVLDFIGTDDRVKLGDVVQIVDKTFGSGGLRIEGRVVKAEVDHLEPKNSRATVGFNPSGFPGQFENMQGEMDGLGQWRDLLQGALAADDTGNLIATADLTVNGAITGESFNLWHGRRTLSSADNIDQLYESGIFYLPGSVPGGTYPSGVTGQYASLLSMGNNADGSSTGWVGRQLLVYGVRVFTRGYAGSPRAWTAWQELEPVPTTTTETTVANIATAASGYGISNASWSQLGKVATFYVTFTHTAALNANTLYTLGTLVTGKRPAQYSPGTIGTAVNAYGNVQINTNGNIAFRPSASVAAGVNIPIRATIVLP